MTPCERVTSFDAVALFAYASTDADGTRAVVTADDVMTVSEAVDYLKVVDRTIYRLVANGDMPVFNVGGSWRFRKFEIDR